MKKISNGERELISTEFVLLAERLLKHGLSIPEARHTMSELLLVSV